MSQRRLAVVDLVAQIVLAMAIGLSVSVVLAGTALLLASGEPSTPGAAAAANQAGDRR